jgi:hypothetical protein
MTNCHDMAKGVMTKGTVLQIRVSDEEKARWEGQAGTAGVRLSTWVRQRCNEGGNGSLPKGGEASKEPTAKETTDQRMHEAGGVPEPPPRPTAATSRFARAHPDWCRCPSCRSILTKERLAKEGIG